MLKKAEISSDKNVSAHWTEWEPLTCDVALIHHHVKEATANRWQKKKFE